MRKALLSQSINIASMICPTNFLCRATLSSLFGGSNSFGVWNARNKRILLLIVSLPCLELIFIELFLSLSHVTIHFQCSLLLRLRIEVCFVSPHLLLSVFGDPLVEGCVLWHLLSDHVPCVFSLWQFRVVLCLLVGLHLTEQSLLIFYPLSLLLFVNKACSCFHTCHSFSLLSISISDFTKLFLPLRTSNAAKVVVISAFLKLICLLHFSPLIGIAISECLYCGANFSSGFSLRESFC